MHFKGSPVTYLSHSARTNFRSNQESRKKSAASPSVSASRLRFSCTMPRLQIGVVWKVWLFSSILWDWTKRKRVWRARNLARENEDRMVYDSNFLQFPHALKSHNCETETFVLKVVNLKFQNCWRWARYVYHIFSNSFIYLFIYFVNLRLWLINKDIYKFCSIHRIIDGYISQRQIY